MHLLDRLLAHTIFASGTSHAALCRDCIDEDLRDELAALSWGAGAPGPKPPGDGESVS